MELPVSDCLHQRQARSGDEWHRTGNQQKDEEIRYPVDACEEIDCLGKSGDRPDPHD